MIFEKIKYYPINWENGMKLSSAHFRHLEDSIEDGLRDGRAIASYAISSYGLLPDSPFVLQNSVGERPQSVRVTLNACRAVLPGGFRVEILPEMHQKEQLPAQMPYVEFVASPDTRYHIFLTIDPQQRVPAGIPETRPIRLPHLCHDYRLECVPHDKAKMALQMGANRMKVAEYMNGKVVEAYIPACISIKGFPLLEKWFQFFQSQLENITRIAAHVIGNQKVNSPAKAAFCLALINHIKSTRQTYKWILPHRSPVEFVAYFGDLASLVEGLIETADRDFVRNTLKNGDINDLSKNIQALVSLQSISHSEMAIYIIRMKKFSDALIATLQSFVKAEPPKPKVGERNVSSG